MTDYRVVEAAGRCRLGESPFWSVREQALYWVDILGRAVHRLRFDDDLVTHWQLPQTIGWLVERSNGSGFVAGLGRDIVLLTLEPLTIIPLASPEPTKLANRLNDAKADPAGRIWAGTMPVEADTDAGSLYRLDPDGLVTCWDSGYRVSNGPAISPDGRYLYHTDSIRGSVYRFALHADGSISDRRAFIQFEPHEGKPDGMTVDAEGGLWIAVWGGSRVSRYTADGRHDRSIALPASQITSCAFAGGALNRLFVTSAAEGAANEPLAGALFEVIPQIHGLAPERFRG